MLDSFTKKRIRVVDDEGDEPYIIVRVEQLDAVKAILDRVGCRYDADDDRISINGHPFATFVTLDPRADVPAIQKLLDESESSQVTRPRRRRSVHRG
jgi:hypothetical protein